MTIGAFLSLWAGWFWGVSWQLCLLFPIVLLANRFLHRAPARLRYALLALLFVKLTVSPSLTAPWSVGQMLTANPQTKETWLTIFSDPLRAGHTDEGFDQSIGVAGNPDFWAALSIHSAHGPVIVAGLFFVWAIGVGLLFGSLLWNEWQLARAVRGGRIVQSGDLFEDYRAVATELGVKSLPRLVLLREAATPFLCGLFRPTIVLPSALPGLINRCQLRDVLLHELTHLKRHDLAQAWIVNMLQAIFWFHPVVWVAGEMLAEERELCVDEALVQTGQVESVSYCRTLLDLCSLQPGNIRHALAFLGIARRPTEVERRIHNLLRILPTHRPIGATSWVFLVLFSLTFLPMGPARAAASPAADDSADAASALVR